jgi:5-methylthioadenosine/S-adenosylhomocysteine deaminase
MKHSTNKRVRVRAAAAALVLLNGCGGGQDIAGTTRSSAAEDSARIDLIMAGDYVVTMDDAGTVLTDAAVAVDQGVIVDVASRADIEARYAAETVLEGEGKVLMPGLINGHTHAAMSLLRGIADDLELMEWLQNYIFPAEVEFVDAQFVRIGTELACWEMIRGGTTTFVDMYYYPDEIAQIVEQCGLRALVSATVIDQRSPDAESANDSLEKGVDFIGRWKERNPRITPIFGPHANYTLSAEQLSATRDAAREAGVPVSIHLAESMFEIEYSKSAFGATSIQFFESIGFFDGPTIAAHVVWPSEDEIGILSERRVGVIHNPTSNMKISSGISPVADMLAAGVPVGLGTDGAASNNDLDMWEEMRLAALLQKVATMDPTSLPAATVLRMATSGGADAIGVGDITGSIVAGKQADLIQVSLDDVHFVPTYDIISHLVYVADEQDVTAVVVAGELLMNEGELFTIDTVRLKQEANALAAKIAGQLPVLTN